VAVRPELPDGSIPLDESAAPQSIVWTDPRDWKAEGRLPRPQPARSRGRQPNLRLCPRRDRYLLGLIKRPSREQHSANPDHHRQGDERVDSDLRHGRPSLDTHRRAAGHGGLHGTEQFRDPKSVDVRADIYGFGVVLFEMITGDLPFKARSLDALGRQHSLYPPPSIVPSVPSRHAKLAKGIDAIVQRCLKKEPTDRFNSVAEMAPRLQRGAGTTATEVVVSCQFLVPAPRPSSKFVVPSEHKSKHEHSFPQLATDRCG